MSGLQGVQIGMSANVDVRRSKAEFLSHYYETSAVTVRLRIWHDRSWLVGITRTQVVNFFKPIPGISTIIRKV